VAATVKAGRLSYLGRMAGTMLVRSMQKTPYKAIRKPVERFFYSRPWENTSYIKGRLLRRSDASRRLWHFHV